MKRGRKKIKKIDREIKKAIKPKKKEFNKKPIIILAIIVLSLLVLATFFFLLKNLTPTTKVIEKPPTPENCSNESIKKVWESVFKGSSENLTIITVPESVWNNTNSSYEENLYLSIFFPGGCPVYSIYQVNGNNIKALMSVDAWLFIDIKMISALSGEFNQEAIENITSSLKNNSKSYGGMESFLSILITGYENGNNTVLPRNITSIMGAKSQFESVFKITSSNWTREEDSMTESQGNITIYGFNESEEIKNITIFGESINPEGEIAKTGIVFGNFSLEEYIYYEISLFGILETLEKKFGNWTSPINTSIEDITIQINNSKLELLKDYEDIQKVKILEDDKTRIETEINFTDNFDWTKIVLKKQNESSERGYIIINGLNYTKNVTVDRLDDKSYSVCIKDKEINSISEISSGCNSANEYLINCSNNTITRLGNFTCKMSRTKFIVTGLAHSGIVEIIPPEQCTPDWSCDEWTNYEKNCGYRICTDLNDCENISNKPIEQKECPVCIPNWECTDFSPEKCPKTETKTRTCTDINNCETSQGEPSLTQTCKRTKTSTWIIIGAVLIILMVLIIILSLERKRRQAETSNKIPVTHEKNYKEDPNYPSNLEQGYSLERTYEFGPPINPDKEED